MSVRGVTAKKVANETLSHMTAHVTPLEEHSTIFVSIPSYRDSETPKTLQQMFKTAKYPDRITALVNEQNDRSVIPGKVNNGDASATNFPGSSRYLRQIRLLQRLSSEARGPVVARAQIEQELYDRGEADYWLQIDSHTAFIKYWDVQLIRQHNQLPDPDIGLLTTLPADYNPQTRNVPQLALPNYIGFHDFNKTRRFPTQQRYQYKSFPENPRKSLFFSANFSFCPAEIIERVPYDPNLNYVFLGEEISMCARFYTSGYELYNPTTMITFHLTNRNYRPTYWEQLYKKNSKASATERKERRQLEQVGMERLWDMLLHGNNLADGYGLGTVRTLEEFQLHIGVDLQNQVATPRSKLGTVENASDKEWVEKYGVTKDKWNVALLNMAPVFPPHNLMMTTKK